MFLFIFESIGTSELLMIGLLALIFLGPRRMPELARKAGKMMNEFRGTANEFKETWQREVDLTEEAKLLDLRGLEEAPVARTKPNDKEPSATPVDSPVIREADPEMLERLRSQAAAAPAEPRSNTFDPNDKKNWL